MYVQAYTNKISVLFILDSLIERIVY